MPPGPPPLTAEDRLEIRELLARYSWADDTADGEGFAAVFTTDGVFASSTHNARGQQELAALGRQIAPEPPLGIQHWTTNLILEGDGERAFGRCYFILHRRDEHGVVSSGSLGYYEDELVKVDGAWRFARRHFRRWPPGPAT